MKINKNIGLVFATEYEAKPFIDGLSLGGIVKKPFEIYSNKNIYLVISGIGKSNAAIAVSYIIMNYKIETVFNIGAAGATGSGMQVGDIFHIDSVVEYDRPRLSDRGIRIKKPDVLDGYPTAVLSTQDKPVISPEERMELSGYAALADMEGAAVIHACRLFEAECYIFKIVTDTPDHKQSSDILKNMIRTRGKMYDFMRSRLLNEYI